MTPTQGWTSIIVWAIIVALISGSGISLMFFRPTPTTHRETEYISCSRWIRNGFQDKTARSVMLSFSRATNTSPSLPVSYQTHPRPLRNGMLKPLTGVNPFYRTRGKVNFPALECKLPQTQQEADILNSNVISWYYTPVQ